MLLGVASLQMKNNEGFSISFTPYGFKKQKWCPTNMPNSRL